MAVSILTVIGSILGAMGAMQGMAYAYPPYITGRSRQTYERTPNVLPPLDMLVSMRYRGVIDYTQYVREAEQLGYDSPVADRIFDTSKRMLDADEYIRSWRRGIIDDQELNIRLRGLHFNTEDIDTLKKVTEYFPPPPDLIRFAIREVYNPATREKYEMDSDITDEYLSESYKAGLPPEQAKNYWASHWILPAVQQGYEMLHRGEIGEEELMDLLRALDIMPYWRDKLKNISYHPYTRVDVRRMNAFGVISDEDLPRAYMDLGFDEEKAGKMTEFTIAYNSKRETGITRANVIKAYKDELINLDELRSFLESFGYTEATIDFWLSMAEFEKAQDEYNEQEANLRLQYSLGAISKQEYARQLGVMGVPATTIDRASRLLDNEDTKKLKMPTKTDLENWLELGLIDEEYYSTTMRSLGYRDREITLYLSEIAEEQDITKVKYLGIGTYARWLKKGILTEEAFRDIASNMDISEEDTDRLVAEALPAEE